MKQLGVFVFLRFVCDENATLELKVKTVKYFKGLMAYHMKTLLNDEETKK